MRSSSQEWVLCIVPEVGLMVDGLTLLSDSISPWGQPLSLSCRPKRWTSMATRRDSGNGGSALGLLEVDDQEGSASMPASRKRPEDLKERTTRLASDSRAEAVTRRGAIACGSLDGWTSTPPGGVTRVGTHRRGRRRADLSAAEGGSRIAESEHDPSPGVMPSVLGPVVNGMVTECAGSVTRCRKPAAFPRTLAASHRPVRRMSSGVTSPKQAVR